MSEIVWDIEGLGKALCTPALLRLPIDVKRDQSTSQIVLKRNRSSASFKKDTKVDAMDRGPYVSLIDRVPNLRHLALVLELRQLVEFGLIN